MLQALLAAAIPNPGPAAPPGLGDLTNTILAWIKWGCLVSGVAGLMICGGMMILGRRNRNQLAIEGVSSTVWVFGGLALVATAAGLVSVVV